MSHSHTCCLVDVVFATAERRLMIREEIQEMLHRSLRLTHQLRYSLALDPDKHLIYIRDAKNPSSRGWNWATNQPRSRVGGPHSPALQDHALISRIRNSATGHVVIVIGGLYTAGEFLTDPQLMQAVAKVTQVLAVSTDSLRRVSQSLFADFNFNHLNQSKQTVSSP